MLRQSSERRSPWRNDASANLLLLRLSPAPQWNFGSSARWRILPTAKWAAAQLTQPKRIAVLLYLSLAEPRAFTPDKPSWRCSGRRQMTSRRATHCAMRCTGLRQVLGESAIVAHGDGYVGIDRNALRCDALEVRRL